MFLSQKLLLALRRRYPLIGLSLVILAMGQEGETALDQRLVTCAVEQEKSVDSKVFLLSQPHVLSAKGVAP